MLAIAVAGLVLFPVAADGAQPPATGDLGADALWVWSWEDPDELAEYTVANGFDRVYLFAEGGFGPKVRSAIAALGAEGVAVEALGGEKRWATDHRSGMLSFVRSARRYDREAPRGAELAGVHVDVEPYGLNSWHRDELGTSLSLLHSLAAARRVAGELPFAADIPFWFDEIRLRGAHRSLAEAIIDATDATTIMAYRDDGPAVIEVARQEVRMAGRMGKSATVGVETGQANPEQVTFYEEGRAELITALAQIRIALGAKSGFGGTAVHYYGSLIELGS